MGFENLGLLLFSLFIPNPHPAQADIRPKATELLLNSESRPDARERMCRLLKDARTAFRSAPGSGTGHHHGRDARATESGSSC